MVSVLVRPDLQFHRKLSFLWLLTLWNVKHRKYRTVDIVTSSFLAEIMTQMRSRKTDRNLNCRSRRKTPPLIRRYELHLFSFVLCINSHNFRKYHLISWSLQIRNYYRGTVNIPEYLKQRQINFKAHIIRKSDMSSPASQNNFFLAIIKLNRRHYTKLSFRTNESHVIRSLFVDQWGFNRFISL